MFSKGIKKNITQLIPENIRSYLRYILKLIKIIPLAISEVRLAYNYAYDFTNFIRWSSVRGSSTQTQLGALITMDYHRIEKGLALKEPKVGFGTDIIERLLSNLWEYQKKYGVDEIVQISINTLVAYYEFNLNNSLKNDRLYHELLNLKEIIPADIKVHQGGVLKITGKQIIESSQINFRDFVNSRYSIRHFAPIDVEISLIEKAIEMAQKTPSVCNRQSSKVHIFTSNEDKSKVLKFQNGNRGFGEQISKVLIVTSDLQNFVSAGERNQSWIDGGMFSMSLVYALHSLGLGTCCLNWSVQHQTDTNLKQVAGIKDSEVVIMMIAVGHLPNELNVAQSPRKNICEVMIVH
ncbi:nitroreductase family protein [Nostoc sp. FACHB-190]|nr:nitroreductase family protein [Nostoc sp. FACHB-190]